MERGMIRKREWNGRISEQSKSGDLKSLRLKEKCIVVD
jgi:hypothetical protein